jgi:4-alpha-glucanotransferase
MGRRAVLRSHVLQMEAFAPDDPFRRIPRASLAGLNTHDMPTFAGFWEGEDIDRRARLGQLDAGGVRQERAERAAVVDRLRAALERRGKRAGSPGEALDGCLELLAGSPARVVLLNLEDLWLEPEPQNVPGTGPEHPNWRRRARHAPAELDRLPDVRRRAERVAELRREAA